MNTELYFLRSSEAKITTDMLSLAHKVSEENIEKYTLYYGLKATDLGLYALHLGEVAGAIWSRDIDSKATLSVALLEKFRGQGIGSQMMNQFLLEAAALYEEIKVDAYNADAIRFYEKFGFEKIDADNNIMIKKLEKKEVVRPSDGYDPTRWMD